MTRKEAAKALAIMQVNYPESFREKNDETLKATFELWANIFADDTYEDVLAAVMAHMATDTNRFMPPVGVIKNMLVKLESPEATTEQEAWECVSKALRNSIYNAEREFEKLPEVVQRVVGSPNMLREWAAVDLAELQTVIASNFQRSFRACVANDRVYQALPKSVKVMFSNYDTRELEGEV